MRLASLPEGVCPCPECAGLGFISSPPLGAVECWVCDGSGSVTDARMAAVAGNPSLGRRLVVAGRVCACTACAGQLARRFGDHWACAACGVVVEGV